MPNNTPPINVLPDQSSPPRPRIGREDAIMAGGLMAVSLLSFPMPNGGTNWAASQSSLTLWTTTCLIGLAMSGALIWRRANPSLMLTLVSLGALAHLLVFDDLSLLLAAVPLAAYAVGRWGSRRLTLICLLVDAVIGVLASIAWVRPIAQISLWTTGLVVAFCWAVMVAGLAGGRAMAARALTAQAEELARHQAFQTQMERRHQAALLAQANDRAAIARDLHDVLAHSLAVMVLQADGGQALAAKDPQAAVTTLNTVAQVGREAIAEMRHIVDRLRQKELTNDGEPPNHPTLGDIEDMVANAGPRASLTVKGQPPCADASIHETIYRVTQESLTNFIKHAGPTARAKVMIVYQPDGITLDVVDDGRAQTGHNRPQAIGHGLVGMRERLSLVDGQLMAGPRPKGGFAVQAWVPLARQPEQVVEAL